jgi:monofunctional biosynthetic peptidoglycan transglycosylase
MIPRATRRSDSRTLEIVPQTAVKRAPKAAAKRKRGWFARIFRWAFGAVVVFYLCCAAWLFLLKFVYPFTTPVQVQRRVEAMLAHKPYQKRYSPVPLDRIDPDLQHAVIAAEDGRFYLHRGIDWVEVQKIVDEDLEEGKLGRGGSTITQQLLKNLFATTHRSLIRKVLEFTLAPVAEQILGKQRILALYLNVIEWGPGVYGAEAAAQFHYKTTAAKLSREQAARLAAVIPSPRRRRVAAMNDYSAIILDRMSKMGY